MKTTTATFYFFILIGCHRNKFGFFEDKRSKRTPTQINDRIGSSDMKTRLILVHRIENRLNR